MALSQFSRATAAARQILSDYCLEKAADGPIEALAMAMNVFVKQDRLDGAAAMLTWRRDSGIVTVNTNTVERGRRMFAVAHELGHFRLHKDKSAGFACTDEMFMAWYKGSTLEPEANAFAAELLMPESSFRRVGAGHKPSRDLFQHICDHFQTSLTASCFRYVETECYPCALFVAVDGKLKWVVKSRDLAHYKIRPIGQILDNGSCAGEFFETGRTDELEPQQVLTSTWFSEFPRELEFVHELPFCTPRLNMTVSLVWPQQG